MPTARRCQGCGATLGEPQSGASVVTCLFCGLAHDTAAPFGAFGRPTIVVQQGQPNRGRNRLILGLVLVVLAVTVAGALIPAILGLRIAQTVVERSTADVRTRSDAHTRAVGPADLAMSPAGGGWRVLTTEPPAGGFTDFDPVASIPWAMAIGRAWASDAVLTRVDLGRVAATGAVDLAGEQATGYRFASPGRHQQGITETETGGTALTATGLMLQITASAVRALPYQERYEAGAPPPVSLPLADILARARRTPEFADKPFYSGYLIHLPREGWVWYFRGLSGGSYPRVRARDGRTYPYR